MFINPIPLLNILTKHFNANVYYKFLRRNIMSIISVKLDLNTHLRLRSSIIFDMTKVNLTIISFRYITGDRKRNFAK